MKNLLKFCFVLCSIVLATMFFTKAYSADLKKEKIEHIFGFVKAELSTHVSTLSLDLGTGVLPERIQLPAEHVEYINIKNDESRDLENKILKPITYNGAQEYTARQ